jgi:hypothetical protein
VWLLSAKERVNYSARCNSTYMVYALTMKLQLNSWAYILHGGETEKLMVSINKAHSHATDITCKTNYCLRR